MPNRTPEERKATPATAQELFVLSQAVNRLTRLVVACLVAIPLSVLAFIGVAARFAGEVAQSNDTNQHVQDCRGVVGGGITNDQAQLLASLGRLVVASNRNAAGTRDQAAINRELGNVSGYANRLTDRVDRRPRAVKACAASDANPTDTDDRSPTVTTSPP